MIRAPARLLLGLCLALLLAGQAMAQATFSDGGSLEITAEEGIEWQREEQVYLARGNAVARRDDMTVRAQVLAAHYRRDDEGQERIIRVEAIGDVIVETANERVTGDRAIYYVDERSFRVTGDDLRLETDTEVVTAEESLEYFEAAEGGPLAVARGNAVLRRPAEGEEVRGEVISARFSGTDGPSRESLVEVQAEGGIEVSSDSVVARGARGVYYAAEQTAVLDGDVKVTRGQTQLNGERAEIDLRTGVSRLLAGEGTPARGLLSQDDLPGDDESGDDVPGDDVSGDEPAEGESE